MVCVFLCFVSLGFDFFNLLDKPSVFEFLVVLIERRVLSLFEIHDSSVMNIIADKYVRAKNPITTTIYYAKFEESKTV